MCRVTDAHTARFDDGDAAGESAQIRGGHELGDEAVDPQRAEREWAKEDDAGMRSGRMPAQVGKLDIERQQHAFFDGSGAGDLRIGPGQEIFICGGKSVVPLGDQQRFQVTREVLIELELHAYVPVFQTLSCARSAA